MKYFGFFLLFLLVFPIQVLAQELPENNKFGIHIAQAHDEDIERADELVNSSGGEWGYITLVIQENDRDVHKWQSIFNKLREKKLIPIIRLATQPENANWRRPNEENAKEWVSFLDKLNWVVKDRYIILFNEPNHAAEWGGEVDAVSFAKVNKVFAEELKKSNSDYIIMMGGLDLSAPSSRPHYEDAGIFFETVINEIGSTDFNKLFDGLASHSYPNPGFVGSPSDTGRKSVRGYEWELQLLQSLGVKELPVFITETGWNGSALSRETVARNFNIAFNSVWLPDKRVKAVTPFILNYQTEPFLQFSWVKPQNVGVYPEFELVKSLPKERGNPSIRQSGRFLLDLPKEIVERSTYHFQIELENTGQAIWEQGEYSLQLEGIPSTRYLISSMNSIKPNDTRIIDVYITTGTELGITETQFILFKGEKEILRSKPWSFIVVPLPSLEFEVSLFPKFDLNLEDFELQFFDEYEQLVFKTKGIDIKNGKGMIDKVENIALGRKYRVVILKQYYLPRQTYVVFKEKNNSIQFERMLPFDFTGDGAFRWNDVTTFFTSSDGYKLLLPF
ncbi:MAG TPA: hypothetical protein PLS49_02075 [Candidatus Woesebacteria bacterium]|nr:hypothetical protein [Candidatus Woesebacteria bacterium]